MRTQLIFISLLFVVISCNTRNNSSDKTDANQPVKSEINTDTIKQTEGQNNDTVKTKSPKIKITKKKPDEVPGLISKSGRTSAEAKPIEDKDEALNLRRARTNFNNGTNYYKQGELEKAIESYKISLEFNPDNYKAFYSLGKIYYELGQEDLSLSYYLDAIEVNPLDSLSMMGIGIIYYDKGDIQNALNYYKKTLEIAPGFSYVYFNRGTMLGQNKQYDKSIEDLTKAIKYDKDFSEAYVNRGLAYFYSKDLKNACKDWQKAKEMGNEKGVKAVSIYCEKKEK